MSLKDDIAADIDSFLDLSEFAALHVVEGREINAVLYDESIVVQDREYSLTETQWTLQARTTDLPKNGEAGDALDIDGILYTVDTWREEMGMSVITLRART